MKGFLNRLTLTAMNGRGLLWLLLLWVPPALSAAELHVAVASNFSGVMKVIAARFEAQSGHRVILSFGSTGKHYAQIKNGAPFDLFFAADAHRPELLEQAQIASPGSRFTYAIGRVVLWSPSADYVDGQGDILNSGRYRYLAIANPILAPYGKAAREVLETRGLWADLNRRMVRGENIAQTFQFVSSGNAELGFVAYSQIRSSGRTIKGSVWVVPQALYTPIKQQAVLLREGEAARALMAFVRSDGMRRIIQEHGYDIP